MNSTLPNSPKRPQHDQGEAYLRLQLDQQTSAALPLNLAQKAVVVPASQIVPIPNMPTCILGLFNQRSRVFWVIDLPQLLNLNAVVQMQQYSIVVVRVGECALGLAVQEVKGVMRLMPNLIQSPAGTAPNRAYLQGYIEPRLLILNVEAIVHSSKLQTP